MSISLSIWIVTVVAFVGANLPFINKKFLLFVSLSSVKKLPVHCFELVVYYILVGCFGLIIENNISQIAAQNWEFFAVTLALFLTFSFPGFVYRYLLKGT
jgi:Protein of unknown function (DUF2818)